jgi:hypothetical protein
MSELQALLGVWGAVDEVVTEHPELTDDVARLLCPYRSGAAGWSRPFVEWVRVHGGGGSPPFPPLERALEILAETVPRRGWLGRRLLAAAVLTRVLQRTRALSDVQKLIARALKVKGLADSAEKARALVALLADTEVLADLDSWKSALGAAFAKGLIGPEAAAQTQPPCAAQVVPDALTGRPVALLETSFCTPTNVMTLARAEQFLDPGNWPRCCSLWCDMRPVPGGVPPVRRYLEVLSLDCDGGGFELKTVLDFASVQLPTGDGAMVEYRISPDQSAGGDGLVTVDDGSIEVRQVGGEVCVKTTKRLQFAYPFEAGALAMIACALGYSTVGEDLVYNCAMDPTQKADAPFQGGQAPSGASSSSGQGGSMSDVVTKAVEAVQRCVRDCADAYQAAYDKMAAGTYSSSDLAADITHAGARYLRDLGTAADLGARTVRIVASNYRPPGPKPPDPGDPAQAKGAQPGA